MCAPWLADFEVRAVVAIGFGVLTLHRPRTNREPFVDLMDVPWPVEAPMGPTVLAGLDARTWLAEPGQVYCATTAEAYRDLVPLGLPLRVVHSREGMWVTSGQALWQRKAPSTEFVVLTRD